MPPILLATISSQQPPSSSMWVLGALVLLCWMAAFIGSAYSQRRRLRAPLILLATWLLSTLIWRSTVFSLAFRDWFELISCITIGLAAARVGWILVVDLLLREGERVGLSKIARDLLQSGLMLVVTIVAARTAGADPQALATTGGLVTAGLTFSLQQTLGDLVAGVLLSAKAPFKIGDWVGYDDSGRRVGRVVEINWRDTRLLTNDMVELIVPNSVLAKASILNFSQPVQDTRRIVSFDIGYHHPPHQVLEAARRAVTDGVDGVLQTPSLDVIVQGFEASSVRYAVRYFLADYRERDAVDSRVRVRLWYALRRAGIDFQFSHLDVRMLDTAPVDTDARAQNVEESLRSVDFLKQMDESDVTALAQAAIVRLFHRGETVVHAGETTTEMFIVTQGRCVVRTAEGRELAQLGVNEFFGEMALLTGEPRSATVCALEDTTLVTLDRETFRTVIARYPEKLERVSLVVAERQAAMDARKGADVTQKQKLEEQNTMLGRMRRFFAFE
ncbi:MAG: mechanosensitive ion channel family protein [Deltaproteobacteria bacterium]|nr:mechanosensitive ion channel family protein [Deltaproteobacteria bacterium]